MVTPKWGRIKPGVEWKANFSKGGKANGNRYPQEGKTASVKRGGLGGTFGAFGEVAGIAGGRVALPSHPM
jgi:hypothetical protein